MTTPINSDDLKKITQQLADVELPPAPDWQPIIVAAIVVIIALLLSIGVVYLRSRRKQAGVVPDTSREALYQLQLLQHKWQLQEINDHDAAYQLATLLRLGLELKQLTETPPSSLTDQQPQWQALLQQLTQLRYTPADATTPLTPEVFTQVATWLKQAHGQC